MAKVDSSLQRSTVRHILCHMLVQKDERCEPCRKFRDTLHSLTSRQKRMKSTPLSIYANVRYMNTPQKATCIRQLQTEKRPLQKKVIRLQNKIASHTLVHGVTLSTSLEQDLNVITAAHHCQVTKSYPENSFQQIFWKSQTSGSPKGKRWHPTMITNRHVLMN